MEGFPEMKQKVIQVLNEMLVDAEDEIGDYWSMKGKINEWQAKVKELEDQMNNNDKRLKESN
jgi:hypothetical protein